jgi:hypothetical protein
MQCHCEKVRPLAACRSELQGSSPDSSGEPTKQSFGHSPLTLFFEGLCFVGQARSPKRSAGVSAANAPDNIPSKSTQRTRQARGFAALLGAALPIDRERPDLQKKRRVRSRRPERRRGTDPPYQHPISRTSLYPKTPSPIPSFQIPCHTLYSHLHYRDYYQLEYT